MKIPTTIALAAALSGAVVLVIFPSADAASAALQPNAVQALLHAAQHRSGAPIGRPS